MSSRSKRILYVVPGALSSARGAYELERRRLMLQEWAAVDTTVEVVENQQGPASIECAYEEYLAIPGAIELALRGQEDGYDAVILGCFGDPGLDGFRERLSIPVVGPCETAIHVASTLGRRFGLVTVLDSIVEPLNKLILTAGLTSRTVPIAACNIPVLALEADSYPEVRRAGERLLSQGADTLILGCMSMAFLGVAERLSIDLDLPVLNSARTALNFAEFLAEAGLTHSKRTYQLPPKLRASTAASA
jgi:allantoin racemase